MAKKQKTAEETVQEVKEEPVIEETAEPEKKTEEPAEDSALIKALAEKEEYLNALIRERADFENYKKRNMAATGKAYSDGKYDAAARFIPVIDNLERAIASAQESGEIQTALMDGVKLVDKQLKEIFTGLGIEEIEAEGKPFDPGFHNAVMQVEAEEGDESGIVKEVLMKGYKAEDRVLRHSMVKVTQ